MVTNHSQDTLDLVVEVVHCVGIALSLSILTEATLWLAQAIIVTIYRVLNKFNDSRSTLSSRGSKGYR